MRSLEEIRFRLRQELSNLYYFAFPPGTGREAPPPPLDPLPDPAPVARKLRDTPFAAEVIRLANEVLAHRVSIFGQVIETGFEVDWSRDYKHGRSAKRVYFRRVPYLDFQLVGDHKWTWELNRHQHLVLLAQAALFTGGEHYVTEITRQLSSWKAGNPFHHGINWASALEVAFRALSWIWVYHFVGNRLEPAARRELLDSLFRHGVHLEYNLSVYFSPNTHLLGEAVALHALGFLFPQFERSSVWRRLGRRIVLQEMDRQVRPDGSHFEQSSYYHIYALDFFLLHHILEEAPPLYLEKLRTMADYLDALMGPGRRLPFLGDDDGGRLFHPYGDRDKFGRATLATCAQIFPESGWSFQEDDLATQAFWWLPVSRTAAETAPRANPRLFADSGVAVMTDGMVHILVDTGPFGAGRAGHSHSDTLSIIVYRGAEEILIDPGTYSYVASQWRSRFRGSSAHNTVRIGGRDQAEATGPFRWAKPPAVKVNQWSARPEADFIDAQCGPHRRKVLFVKEAAVVFIFDEVRGSASHAIEQLWHLAAETSAGRFTFSGPVERKQDWRSRVYGSKEAAVTLRVAREGLDPCTLAAAIDVSGEPAAAHFDCCGDAATWAGRGLKVTVKLGNPVPQFSIHQMNQG